MTVSQSLAYKERSSEQEQFDAGLNQTSMTDNWWTSSMHHLGRQSHQQRCYNQQCWYQQIQHLQRNRQQQRRRQWKIQHRKHHSNHNNKHSRQNLSQQINGTQSLTYQWLQHQPARQEDKHYHCQRDNNQMRSHKAVSPNNKEHQNSNNHYKDLKHRNHQQQGWGSMPWQWQQREVRKSPQHLVKMNKRQRQKRPFLNQWFTTQKV